MAEVAQRQAWVCVVPAAHGAFAAHGLPGVEEGAATAACGGALGGDDVRDARHGDHAATAAHLALIERREHQAAQILATRAHAIDHLFVAGLVVVGLDVVGRLVAPEAEHDEVQVALANLRLHVRRVEVQETGGARTHETQGVVDRARPIALHHHTVEPQASVTPEAQLEPMRSVGHGEGDDAVRLLVGSRRRVLPGPAVDAGLDRAAVRIALEQDLEARDAPSDRCAVVGLEGRPGGRSRAELNAAVAVEPAAVLVAHDLAQHPVAAGVGLHVAVHVGQVALADQREAVARVAEASLEITPHRVGDQIRGDGRVAVVADARDRVRVSHRRAP